MCLVGQAEVPLRIQRHQTHGTHQALYTLTVDPIPLVFKSVLDTSTAVVGMLKVAPVNQLHQFKLLLTHWLRYVIKDRAR